MNEAANTTPVLDCHELSCHFRSPFGPIRVLHDVSFSIPPRTTLGIVGESGAGKSMLVKTIMGIAPEGMKTSGRILADGIDLSTLNEAKRRALLGRKFGMVFQNPMTSLNPFVRVGRQIEEASRFHLRLGKAQAKALAIELLASVGIPDLSITHIVGAFRWRCQMRCH
jgi:peptide/nickel transport system ATP-binding protein